MGGVGAQMAEQRGVGRKKLAGQGPRAGVPAAKASVTGKAQRIALGRVRSSEVGCGARLYLEITYIHTYIYNIYIYVPDNGYQPCSSDIICIYIYNIILYLLSIIV